MNYKLALALKEAGFPQHENDYDAHIGDCNDDACSPTLSELIKACENPILFKGDNNEWIAGQFYGCWDTWYIDDSLENVVKGQTPEEAVAILYLKINSKL